MLSKLPLIGRILGIAFGIVGVIIFILIPFSEEGDNVYAGFYVDYGIYLSIAAVIIAILSFILALVVNPQGLIGVGIGLGTILVIGSISYFTADGSNYTEYKDVTENTSLLVSAMLTSFYILFAGAILSIVYSLVSRVFK